MEFKLKIEEQRESYLSIKEGLIKDGYSMDNFKCEDVNRTLVERELFDTSLVRTEGTNNYYDASLVYLKEIPNVGAVKVELSNTIKSPLMFKVELMDRVILQRPNGKLIEGEPKTLKGISGNKYPKDYETFKLLLDSVGINDTKPNKAVQAYNEQGSKILRGIKKV